MWQQIELDHVRELYHSIPDQLDNGIKMKRAISLHGEGGKGGGGSRSRFTKNKMAISRFTGNKIKWPFKAKLKTF